MRSVDCGLGMESVASLVVRGCGCLAKCVGKHACAIYIACSRAVVICFVVYARSARDAPGQAVLVYGRAPKTASLGS